MEDLIDITELDNRGRWGAEDERGTLNLITDEVRARAAAEVRTGRSVSLALPIRPTPILSGPFVPETSESSAVQHVMVLAEAPPPVTAAADLVVVTNHHARSTHVDALCHIAVDGLVYPGRPRSESVGASGAVHGSTTAFAEGFVTRGVLLDLAAGGPLPAGHPVTSVDLDAAEERQGVRLEPGDALVVRCGWGSAPDPSGPLPGMSVDAVRWMHRRGVSLFIADVGEALPPLDPARPLPLHAIGLAMMGMPLVDAAAVDDLAAVSAELGRSSFLLSFAPPRFLGLTGVPVNPLAIF
ncbi:cyclase family protein [Umezawaea tangerina]|uniref:Kynurenine formamidase n=1 Tax=Umezawaea tangerina TaxID=84725 RepID=A0A2T0TFN3_9PSEU|nr:cyclase family protein [Umezawaea tangerina]PRY44464.1 kynurenine formamidase [Umezawaea tangerina]